MQPRVIDISHHNTVTDLHATAAAGIWGMIHKATQGSAYVDPEYHERRLQAEAQGLLWGAYHFNTGDPVMDQVDFFLETADPDDETLLVLDFEDYRLSNMSIHQAVEFLHLVHDATGRQAAIYSGNRLKESIGTLAPPDLAYLVSHRLWLCEYGPIAKLPQGFIKWWLWQYTDGQIGPQPHVIPGIGGLTDLNVYDGTREQLIAEWAGAPLAT